MCALLTFLSLAIIKNFPDLKSKVHDEYSGEVYGCQEVICCFGSSLWGTRSHPSWEKPGREGGCHLGKLSLGL